MLIRISLIVAIIAGLAVGALNFVKVKEKITTLVSERDTEKSAKETAQRDLSKTKKELDTTKTDLKKTQDDLAATTDAKDKALAAEAKATQRANQVSEELAKTKTELGDAQATVARFGASGLNPEQVVSLAKDFKEAQAALAGAQDENKLLAKKISKLEFDLARYEGKIPVVYLPQALKGKVLVTDPKWDFVVLDVGENQGVLKDGELLVNRDGKLVAKVIVRSIEKDRSIANVMPGWKLGEVLEGDQVIPAHPQS